MKKKILLLVACILSLGACSKAENNETKSNQERAYHTENVVYCMNEQKCWCCSNHEYFYVCKDCVNYREMPKRQDEIVSSNYYEVENSVGCYETTNRHKHLLVCYKVYEE